MAEHNSLSCFVAQVNWSLVDPASFACYQEADAICHISSETGEKVLGIHE